MAGTAGTRTASKPTVHEAWAAVMGDVQAVGKSGRNTQQNYNFRGIDQVMNAVGPVLREHGVSVVPMGAAIIADERYKSRSGADMRNVTINVLWRVTGPAGDTFTGQSLGEAADSGDKAISKAHSVAYRTFLIQALCLPTDEPDPDSQSNERAAPAEREPTAFPAPDERKRLDTVIARLLKNEWITPQQIASACEVVLGADATIEDLTPTLDGLNEKAVAELTKRLTSYGKNKKAEAEAA